MQRDISGFTLMTRRGFLSAAGALAAASSLGACTTERRAAIPYAAEPPPPEIGVLGSFDTMYAAR